MKKGKRSKTKHCEDKEIRKNNKHYISVFSTAAHAVFPLGLIIHGSKPARFYFKQIRIAVKNHNINNAQNKQGPANCSKKNNKKTSDLLVDHI